MRFWRRGTSKHEEEEPVSKLNAEPALEADEAERLYSPVTLDFPAGGISQIIYSVLDRSAHVVSASLALPPDHDKLFTANTEYADELIGSRLLISERELLERCRAAKTPEPPPPIQTIGIVTRNRVESLRRCLRTCVENCRTHHREVEFSILDDTDNPSGRKQTREMLDQIKEENGVAIRYAGEEEKRNFVTQLIRQGELPPDVINFALFDIERMGYSDGKNRNALFLDTVGEMFFSTDDDVLCRLAVAPDITDDEWPKRDDLLSEKAMEVWVFPDRKTALEQASFVDESILVAHEQMLGKTVASIVAASGDINIFDPKCLRLWNLRAMLSGSAKILVTFNGVLGDSGMTIPPVFQYLSSESRERLMSSEQEYVAARFSRELLRVIPAPNISRQTWTLSTALAYDNRALLPPYLPVLRGSDGVFADVLTLCFEEGFLGTVPRAVLHAPEEDRKISEEQALDTASDLNFCQLMSACVLSCQTWPQLVDPATRLRALGQHLIDLGSISLSDFEEFARLRVWEHQTRRISKLEDALQDYDAPPAYWVTDLEEYLTRMREALAKPDFIVPQDVRSGRSIDDARRLSQRLVLRFGEVLRVWPDVVEATKQLRGEGHRLARKI